jgi:hypothetical protein
MFCAGACQATPVCWETLAVDVRGVILRKLSLYELGCTAPACREFTEEFQNRFAKERAACVAGEETFGKGVFCGFVRAVQQVLCGLGPPFRDGIALLVISPAGEQKLVPQEDRETGGGPLTMLQRMLRGSTALTLC